MGNHSINRTNIKELLLVLGKQVAALGLLPAHQVDSKFQHPETHANLVSSCHIQGFLEGRAAHACAQMMRSSSRAYISMLWNVCICAPSEDCLLWLAKCTYCASCCQPCWLQYSRSSCCVWNLSKAAASFKRSLSYACTCHFGLYEWCGYG
jgi:hypothetical protein